MFENIEIRKSERPSSNKSARISVDFITQYKIV